MKLFEDELFDSVMRKSDLENEIEMMMESAITPLRPFPIPEEDRKNFIEKPFEEIQTKYTLPTSLEKYVKEAENCEELYELLTERYLLDKLGETEFNRLSKDLNKFIQESLETEFSIGAMLPQPGEGGDPSDVEVLAKEEEDDFGDLELESAISYYINDPELEYNFYTEAAVVNAVKGLKEKIVGKVKISTKLYKSMIQRAMLKSKLKVAQKKGTDKKVINDLKQQLIGKEQEIRTLKAGIDPQSIEEIDRIGQKIDKKMEEKEEKEMKAIAEKIISNPNLVASENSEDIEDGNLVTEVFNPFNMIRINCILIAGTWVVLNGLVVGKGAEYIKSKKELRYIEKYYEKTNADFIPFKKAKKKNFKLDKSFDNEEFEVGGKGKKIGKLRNLLGNKVTILFDDENEEICSYALSIDYQSDLSTKISTINYKINKKYKEYNNYYISAICFKHGIERKRSIAWIHKEYKRIKELNKEEKAVKESTLVNISDDERIVTERYIGRSQTLQQAEIVLGKLMKEMKKDPLKDYTNSKLNKQFEALMKKQFGFGEFYMVWKRTLKSTPNAFTLFSSDVIWKGDKIVTVNKKNGFYDKSHTHVCYAQSYQTMVSQLNLTSEEMMGIILHEIGHNFDTSLYYILNVLSSFIKVVYENITVPVFVGIDPYSMEPMYQYQTTRVRKIYIQWLNIILSTGFGKGLFAAWESFIEALLNQYPKLKDVADILRRGADFLTRQFERIIAIPSALIALPVTVLLSPWYQLVSLPTRKIEQYADSFAATYGYGAANTSALMKMEEANLLDYSTSKISNTDNPIIRITNDCAMLNRYLISAFMGDHGSTDTRIHNMIRQLEKDIENSDYPRELKQELKREHTKLLKVYDSYLNDNKDKKLLFTSLIRGFVNRVFNGESDYIAKIFPDNTVNKHFREAGDDIITELLTEKTEIVLKLESAFDLPTEKVVALENRLKYLDNQIKDVETYISEAANIEKEMKPIIEQLNAKGYKTKYSSPGHTQLRKKEDVFRDGIYEGKLYSDARIMFDGDYNFPKAPKYWIWRTVEGNDYLDVDPKAYSFEKGFTPSEMFNKWKAAYMGTLKTWVENLPDQSETKNSPIVKDTKGRETVVESGDIDQIFEDFFKESMNDIDLDLMELGVESVYTEKKRLGKPELSYK